MKQKKSPFRGRSPRFDANGFYLLGENPTEREIQKEMREHPWAGRKTAARIASDHRRRK